METGQDDRDSGWTPLHEAIRLRDKARALTLIRAGAKVEAQDARGITPLYLACALGNAEIARELIAAGARVDRSDGGDGAITVLAAIEAGYLEALEVLRPLARNAPGGA